MVAQLLLGVIELRLLGHYVVEVWIVNFVYGLLCGFIHSGRPLFSHFVHLEKVCVDHLVFCGEVKVVAA